MITFNGIIVRFDFSMRNVGRAFSFMFEEIKSSAIRCSFIRINGPWNSSCFNTIEYFSEKSISSLGVAMRREIELDGLSSTIDSTIKVCPLPIHFDVGFI